MAATTIVNNIPACQPIRTIDVTEHAITVTYEFPEVSEYNNSASGRVYHSILGFGYKNEESMPRVPMRIDSFRIPDNCEVSLTSEASGLSLRRCDYMGVCGPVADTDTTSNFDVKVKNYSGLYPSQNTEIIYSYKSRGEKIIEIAVCPIQYDYFHRRAILCDNLTYTINFTTSVESCNIEEQTDSNLLTKLKKSYIHSEVQIGSDMSEDESGSKCIEYIIVTTDQYKPLATTFAKWKQVLGYTPIIISKPHWNNYDEVLQSVRTIRESHSNVRYLLIIGDIKDVPSKRIINTKYSIPAYYSDNYYGTLTDDDFIRDIYIGRIPVNNTTEAEDILRKLVRLELCPIIDENYYSHAIHCAYFQSSPQNNMEGRRFIKTSEDVLNYVTQFGIDINRKYCCDANIDPLYYSIYWSSGQPLPIFLQRPNYSWVVDPNDIIQEINNGCLYALYRGHGSTDGWDNVGLNISHLEKLKENEMPLTVFSTTCNTGRFNNNCFAEELLKIEDGGASSVIAASAVSYSGFNDVLVAGMFDAIWPNPGFTINFGNTTDISSTPDPSYRMGQILSQGLFRMNEQLGSPKSQIQYQYEIFHLFGDPSLQFFTQNPTSFKKINIRRTNGSVAVSTNGEDASIGIYDMVNNKSYKYHKSPVVYKTANPDSVIVSISGHNKLLYIDPNFNSMEENTINNIFDPKYNISKVESSNIYNISSNEAEYDSVDIYDIDGKLLLHTEMTDKASPISNILQNYSKGLYLVTKLKKGKIIGIDKVLNA